MGTATIILVLLVLLAVCSGTPVGRAWFVTYYQTMRIVLRSRSLEKEAKLEVFNEEARRWAENLQQIFGYELDVRGELPDGPVLLLCNHQSALDIPVLLSTIPAYKACSFMPKLELRKVPLVGGVLADSGAVFLDRSNPQAAKAAMDDAARALTQRSFIVFPEGTRSRNGIMQFKKGAFHMASAAGCRIVPAAIAGSDDLSSLDPPRKLVRLAFGHPLETTPAESVEELLCRVRSEIIQLNLSIGGKGAVLGTESSHVAPHGRVTKKSTIKSWLQP